VKDDVNADAKPGTKHPRLSSMPKNRLEALVDAIFAVAMTLLVLDVKIPQGLQLNTEAALQATLWSQFSNFRIYLISFVMLGMFWVAHHLQFHIVRSVDRVVLWINLLFMLGVTMVPFSTSLLGEYGDLTTPCVIYGVNQLWLAVLYWFQVVYLERNPGLASAALTSAVAARMRRRVVWFMGVPLLSMGVAFINTWVSVHLYVLLIVIAVLPGRIDTAPSATGPEPPNEP
jgi:uncharacterized membrane protein